MKTRESLVHEIIPGILEKDWAEIERKIELVRPFAKTIHIDIIDGKFVNNTTFLDPFPFKKYTSDILFEVHMMVDEPGKYLKSFAAAGFKRFLGHVEKMGDQAEFVGDAQLLGEVGLALDGPTGLDSIKVPFDDLDSVLIYTSDHVGFSGPALLPDRLAKIPKIISQTNIPVEVDGGINDQTILQAKAAGAHRFVSTSYLFSSQNPQETFETLRELLRQA